MKLKLTTPRRRALAILATAGPRTQVRVSNVTRETPTATQCVYWQVANWLLEQRLAEVRTTDTAQTIKLTDAGRQVANELGLTRRGALVNSIPTDPDQLDTKMHQEAQRHGVTTR